MHQCFDKHGMPAVRVYPNYHGYTLQEPRFVQLLEKVTAAGRFLQLASMMEDTRTQHVQHQVADVDLEPLGYIIGSDETGSRANLELAAPCFGAGKARKRKLVSFLILLVLRGPMGFRNWLKQLASNASCLAVMLLS